MIQSSTATSEPLDEIVARLVEKFHPTRMWLFGSRARGDARADSDYDFLVETESVPDGVKVNRQLMTWLDDFPDAEVQVHLRSPGQVERRQNDPGRVDWDVAREGRLVFAARGVRALRPVSNNKLVREPPAGPPDSLAGWVTHAERDLRAAVHLASDVAEFKEGICFHSQQAAEKYLKALLISKHQRPARTHKLPDLLVHLQKIGILLTNLEDDCAFLSPFAVEVRYPDGDDETDSATSGLIARMARPMEVTEDEAHEALAAAQRIIASIRTHLS